MTGTDLFILGFTIGFVIGLVLAYLIVYLHDRDAARIRKEPKADMSLNELREWYSEKAGRATEGGD